MVKRSIDDLAVFGGEPRFHHTLHVGRPNLPDRQALLTRLEGVLDRRWLTNRGPLVQEMEERLADLLEVEHCVATCNGTVALELLTRAAGLRGEVIVPSFTFVATAHCLRWQGLRPVFADVDPATHNLDPEDVERRITPDTSGILAVHLWGRAAPVEELSDICRRHGIQLLFDASHAFCSTHGGRKIGGFGEGEVFSFHATKIFHTLEGGCVTTNDAELAGKLRLMKNFGFAGMDEVIYLGTNGKINEFSCAMGLANLESLPRYLEANAKNAELYGRQLEPVEGLHLLRSGEGDTTNHHYVVAEVDDAHWDLTRDELLSLLHAENVRARRYFWPGCHRMEPYGSDPFYDDLRLPHTEAVASRTICLPTGTAVGDDEIRGIGELFRFIKHHDSSIAVRLRNGGGVQVPAGGSL